MTDSRFYLKRDALSLSDVCALISVPVPEGANKDQLFTAIHTLKEGNAAEIALFHNPKYREDAEHTRVGICLTTDAFASYVGAQLENGTCQTIVLVHPEPYRAYALLVRAFFPEPILKPSIHPTAVIAQTATIGEGCVIGAYVVIGERAVIGAYTKIDSHTVIHDDVCIGCNGRIASHVTISHSLIGDRVLIKPGTCIGQQGFGFHMDEKGHFDVPQVGIVEIGYDVQIGSNVCIDRASLGKTKIGNGVRIDNLVQIAHNVYIGDQSVLGAQVGVAGSTHLGNFVIVAGQVGIAGHLTIGNGVKVAAQSGIMRDVVDGMTVAGSPAVPVQDWRMQTVALQRLVKGRKNGK